MNKALWPALALCLWLSLAFLTPYLPLQNVSSIELGQALAESSSKHLLGTDAQGRDLITTLLWGAHNSFSLALPVVFISAILGLMLGLTGALRAGWIDLFLASMMDLIMAFPGLLLILAMVSLLPSPNQWHLIFLLCAVGWPGYARLVRAEVYRLREKEYFLSTTAMGFSPWRQAAVHLVPNLLSPLLIKMTFGLSSVILLEASLSFLGVGLSADRISWGQAINEGRHFLLERPSLVVYPSLCLTSLLATCLWLGEALLDKHKVGN